MLCERSVWEEEATEEEKKEKAAGAELKTKTPHNDVGKNCLRTITVTHIFWYCCIFCYKPIPVPSGRASNSMATPHGYWTTLSKGEP